jgi:hypothetical protein
MEEKIINPYDDPQYWGALNGRQAGNGYDVFIKRENERTALIGRPLGTENGI